MTSFKEQVAQETNCFEQLQAVEKNYDLLYEFMQSKGLDKEYNKWLKNKICARYVEKPQLDEKYWFIDSDGDAMYAIWNGYDTDEYRWLYIPLWKTQEDAERYLEVQKYIKSKARPFISYENNYAIMYDDNKNKIEVTNRIYWNVNTDHFKTEEIAREIIDRIGFDNLKRYYFLIEE